MVPLQPTNQPTNQPTIQARTSSMSSMSLMSPSSDSIDDLIRNCWNKVGKSSSTTPNEYIYITQLLGLISEIEHVLSIKQFLNEDESKILRKMIEATPMMKLYRKNVQEFVLKLVKFSSFEQFLLTRFHISLSDLRLSLNVMNKGPLPYKPLDNEPTTDHVHKYNWFSRSRSKPDSTQLHSPPQSPRPIPSDSLARDNEINRLELTNKSLQATILAKDTRILELQKEIITVNKHTNNVEQQLRKRPDQRNVSGLLNKIKDKDASIKDLQQVCREHRQEIEALHLAQQSKQPMIDELVKHVTKQDSLIKQLQQKLQLDNKESPQINSILLNLPFIKQYYYLLKYKQESKSWGLVLINTITLILTTIIALNGLRFVLYVTLWIFTTKIKPSDYVYDDYGDSMFSLSSTFEWWKEIEWLEYVVYSIEEWLT